MSDLRELTTTELAAGMVKLADQVREVTRAQNYAFAALVTFLDDAGAVDGRGLAAFLKGRSKADDGERRGDPATLFVIGQMIEEFVGRPGRPGRPVFAVIDGGKGDPPPAAA